MSFKTADKLRKMLLTDLPEVVLMEIFKYVDFKTKLIIYDTFPSLRNVLCSRPLTKRCRLSCSTLASPESLKLEYFRVVRSNIEELDLSGITGLTGSVLLPRLKQLCNLKTLNVAFTDFDILNLVDLAPKCVLLKNIVINLSFNSIPKTRIDRFVLERCEEVFVRFENVHFVGAMENIFYSLLPFSLLQRANIKELTLTGVLNFNSKIYDNFYPCTRMVNFQVLSMYVLNWKDHKTEGVLINLKNWTVFSLLNLARKKYGFVMHDLSCHKDSIFKVHVSPELSEVLKENLSVEKSLTSEFGSFKTHNMVFIVWNNENYKKEEFNDFLSYFRYYDDDFCDVKRYDSQHIVMPNENLILNNDESKPASFKRRRIGTTATVICFDKLFSEFNSVALTLYFDETTLPVSLNPECRTLRNITNLNITDVKTFHKNFFEILFKKSVKLATLNVDTVDFNSPMFISKYIHLSKSVKNFRLVCRKIDFKRLFEGLSDCPTLENVHFYETSSADRSIIMNHLELVLDTCHNLYNLFIQAPISDSCKLTLMRALKKFKSTRKKKYLNYEIHNGDTYGGCSYDPFINVFNISPVKSL